MPMFSFNSSSSMDGRVISKIATKGDTNYISTAEPSPMPSKSFSSSSDAEELDVWEEFYSYLKKEPFWLNILSNEVRWSDPKTPPDLWEEKHSHTYSRSYWKNHLTGETTWQNPRNTEGEITISSAPNSQRDRTPYFMSPRSDLGGTPRVRAPTTCSEPSLHSYHSQHADLCPSQILNHYPSQTLALSSTDRDSRRLSVDSVASSLTSLSRAESPGKRISTREQLLGVTVASYSTTRWSNRDLDSMSMSPTSPMSPTSTAGIDRDFTGPNPTQRHSKGRYDISGIPPPPPRAPPRPASTGSPSHSQFQAGSQSPSQSGALKRTSSNPSLFPRLCTPSAFPCAALSPTVRTYGGHSCAGALLQRQVLTQAQIPAPTSPSSIAMNKDGLLTAEDPNTGTLMVLVVDGHGFEGHRISQYAESKFTKLLFGHPDWAIDVELAMADALEALEEGLLRGEVLRGEGSSGLTGGPLEVQRSGCAAVCAVLRGGVITVANIGDCGASIAYRNNSDSIDTVRAARLTVDHKPDLPGEMRRIEEAGGRVYATVPGEAPQVFKDSRPLLGISRCLGSFDAKRAGVISEPEFSQYNLHENGRRDLALVVGSDGLWAFMSEKSVADVAVSVDNPNLAVDKLFRVATEKWLVGTNGMVDDITVCVVYLT